MRDSDTTRRCATPGCGTPSGTDAKAWWLDNERYCAFCALNRRREEHRKYKARNRRQRHHAVETTG